MLTKTEIITLKSTPFKENSRILQALTKDLGLISIIVNGLSQKNLNSISLCTSFTIAEVILKKRNSDIYLIEEANILEKNLHLRNDFTCLNLASFMTKAILDSHFQQKKTYNIYCLLKTYLKKISINPEAIYISFLLKLLHKEGFLNLKTQCSICKEEAQSLLNGDSICSKHSNCYAFEFSEDDFKKLFILCYAKSFAMLEKIEISKELKDKVTLLFNDLI